MSSHNVARFGANVSAETLDWMTPSKAFADAVALTG